MLIVGMQQPEFFLKLCLRLTDPAHPHRHPSHPHTPHPRPIVLNISHEQDAAVCVSLRRYNLAGRLATRKDYYSFFFFFFYLKITQRFNYARA